MGAPMGGCGGHLEPLVVCVAFEGVSGVHLSRFWSRLREFQIQNPDQDLESFKTILPWSLMPNPLSEHSRLHCPSPLGLAQPQGEIGHWHAGSELCPMESQGDRGVRRELQQQDDTQDKWRSSV